MRFILDLWPDEPAALNSELLAYALESIRGNPDLSWTIEDDAGNVITNDVRATDI